MRESVISPAHGVGVFDRSGFVARKSLFRDAIWLLICAVETFYSSVLKTTLTTVLMVMMFDRARSSAV